MEWLKGRHIQVCKTCQINDKQNLIYCRLTANKAEYIPWDRLSVDLIGPYKIRKEGHEYPLILGGPIQNMSTFHIPSYPPNFSNHLE